MFLFSLYNSDFYPVFIDFGYFSFFCKYYVEATRFCNETLCMLMGSVKLWLKKLQGNWI